MAPVAPVAPVAQAQPRGAGPEGLLGAPAALRRVLELVRLENLVAGVSGGVLSTVALHPLDLAKIRLAVSDGLAGRPRYTGLAHCLRSVWTREGVRGLYQGVTPNMWGAGASWGLYFFFYNAIKAHKQEGTEGSLSAGQHLVSAAQAGAMTLCVTNPVWVVKTRLVLQYEAGGGTVPRRYHGMVHALVLIAREEGVRGLYRGFVPGLIGTSHGALQFMAYEELKSGYNVRRGRPPAAKLETMEYLGMAALSKLFAVSATYPYQVVRARLQDQHTHYRGVWDVVSRAYRNEGMLGFYKGIVPNLLRVTPACCITFVVFENVSSFLSTMRH